MKTSFEKFMASSAVKSVEPVKVEMSENMIEVNLGIIDDIALSLKTVKQRLDQANAADAKIAKAVEVIKKEYGFYAANQKIGPVYTKKGQDLYKKFEDLAKQLGVPVKGSEAEKNICLIFDYADQLNDTVTGMKERVISASK